MVIIPRRTGTKDDDEDGVDDVDHDHTSSHRHCSPFLSTQLHAPQFRVAWVHMYHLDFCLYYLMIIGESGLGSYHGGLSLLQAIPVASDDTAMILLIASSRYC